ncbi:MAG: hypothetical protein QOJ09_712 [Actinomycetota bacterium]|nr:hypothetical protein [Actinomycetota bacterium]
MGESGRAKSECMRRWHPRGEELDRILAEMRPIVREFARQARDAGLVRSA